MESKNKKCCSQKIRVFPYVLITLGLIFALSTLGIMKDSWSKLWPLIFIVIGAVKLVDALMRD